MSIHARGGKWHFRFKLDGKRYAQTTGLDATQRNATKARDQETEFRQALLEGRQPTRRIHIRRFSDAAADFLTWAEGEYREHPNSARRLTTSFATIRAFFGDLPVSVIDDGRIEQYKTWRIGEHQVRDVTLRHDLHALSKFFQYAMKQLWTRDNPVERVKIPSDATAIREHILTDAEEKAYFARAVGVSQDLHDVGRLILNQGCRPEEVTEIAKAHVDLERGRLTIPKGKSTAARRVLDLTSESKLILAARMKGESPWIFPSPKRKGKHVARQNSAHDRLIAAAKKEKPPMAFRFVLYDLRHTFATRMAEAGVDLPSLAGILGHNSLRILQRYVHPTAEHKKAAMAKYDAVMLAKVKEYRA